MKLKGQRNFSERWITGAESVHNSNIRDHAWSDQHECAMNLLKRERAIGSNAPTSSYVPIARALSTISEEEREQLQRKFDSAYFLHYVARSYRQQVLERIAQAQFFSL